MVKKIVRTSLVVMLAAVFVLGLVPPQDAFAASETSKNPTAKNVVYITDDESGEKTGIKSFTIDPYTYSNLSQDAGINPDKEATLKLDDAKLRDIAKRQIFPKWGIIAEGVFRDQANQIVTIEGSGMMSSDTSAKNSFDRHFSTGKVSNGYDYDWAVSDLAAYLGRSTSLHNGKTCWDETRVTGVTQIGNLNDARTLMGQELRNCSDDNDISKDEFLGNNHQKNEDIRRLPDLEDDKTGDGFANIVTCVNRAGASGDYDYVTFGIAVYDFDITPVAAKNLKYVEAADKNYEVDNRTVSGKDILMGLGGDSVNVTGVSFQNDTDEGTTTYIQNKTAQEVTQSSGLENNVTEESSISTDDTYEWGMEQEVGTEFNFGGFENEDCMFPRATVSFSNSFHELWSTTKSKSETKSTTKTKTTNTEVTLPGHTIAVVKQSLNNKKTTENYQQPVILNYKVAIFAMSGDYFNGASGGIENSRYDKQWMSVIFDGSDDYTTSGCYALGSLYNRGVANKDTSGYDGAKGKYRSWCDKSAWNSSSKINWNSVSSTLSGDNRSSHRIELSTGKKATTVRDLATELPLLEKAQMLTSKRESITSSVEQIVALYPLDSVSMTNGSKQYELVPRGQQSGNESNILHLDSIKLEGFDGAKEGSTEFYGFDPAWGQWELLDENNEVIEDGSDKDKSEEEGVVQSGLIKLVTDDDLDSQWVEVTRGDEGTAEEECNIKWKLKKGEDAKIISNENLNSDTSGKPYMSDADKDKVTTPTIKIMVKNRESDIENFETGGSYKGPWNEAVNLGHVLSADAVDSSGKIRGVPIYWESKGTPGINVEKNGDTTFTKKGTYEVRPYSYNIEDKKIIPTDSNGKPIWIEVTAQDKSQLSSIVINKPELSEDDTTLTEGITSLGFNLSSYTRFFDQYGDKWEGDIVETTDEETGKVTRKTVFPEVKYSVTPSANAIVDDENILTISKKGTYTVSAKAYDEDGNDIGITIKPITITVGEQERLASITFDRPGLSRDERTLKEKNDYVVVKDLKNLLHYTDQFGDEWTGKKPNVTFSVEGVGEAAEVSGGNFYAYAPGRYTIEATAAGYEIEPITIVILEDPTLVLKAEDPGRQYLYTADDEIELELERYIDAATSLGGKWKGKVPALNFTLDGGKGTASIETRTVYENDEDYEGEDRHFFKTKTAGEYTIHVAPKKASEYTEALDDINIRVVKGKKVAKIEFMDISEMVDPEKLMINTYTSSYPEIDLSQYLKYYDGFGEEIDPAKDHVKIPDCQFKIMDEDFYEEGSYTLNRGIFKPHVSDVYFIEAAMNVTNYDPSGEDPKEDTILGDMTAVAISDIDWLHNFEEWRIVEAPTCTKDGVRVKRCTGGEGCVNHEDGKVCDEEIFDTIPATGHQWDPYYAYSAEDHSLYTTCTECGAVNEDSITNCPGTPANGWTTNSRGQNVPNYYEKKASCTEQGQYKIETSDGQKFINVPAVGHTWKARFEVIEQAKCSKEGLEGIRCEKCDAVQEGTEFQRSIPKTPHVPDEANWQYDKDIDGNDIRENCEDYGIMVTNCKNDGCDKPQFKIVDPIGHDWDEGVVKTKPACTKAGEKVFTCSHENCPIHTRSEAIPATGHQWDAGTVTKAPTTTATGVKTYTCTVCKETATETIPKLDKKANTLNVTAKTAKLKAKKVKKKAQKLAVTKVLTFKNKGQGKLTYVKASGNKKITIAKTTGKVTVKKKLKKGTYKVKVKVTAAGNANYNAATKTVTFTVKIK